MNTSNSLRRTPIKAIPSHASLIDVAMHRPSEISSIRTLLSQQENEVCVLANGHKIGYSIYGSPKAPALFFLHGQGSSRLQGLAKSAHTAGLQIICPDRPGIGLSTYDHQRKLLDYPLQIAELAKHLELDTYRVIGGSGGGPYASACAYALPRTQLCGAAVLAGVGPPEDPSFSQMPWGTRLLFASLGYAPGLVGILTDLLIGRDARNKSAEDLQKTIEQQMKYVNKSLAPSEREAFEKPEFIRELIQDLQETFRQGSQGFVRDGQLMAEPWGFRLEDVSYPGIRLYYGSKDINTPSQMGRNTQYGS